MNLSNSSSFVGFIDSTSTGGNSVYSTKNSMMVLIDNGKLLIPNDETKEAILESDQKTGLGFSNIEDLFVSLND